MKWISKKGFKYSVASCILCVVMLVFCIAGAYSFDDYVEIGEDEVPMANLGTYVVDYTKDDMMVKPDKYNTGAKGELFAVGMGDTIQGVTLKVGNNGTANQFDFKNVSTQGSVLSFEGIDFSKGTLAFLNEHLVESKVQVNFTNCKFAAITTSKNTKTVSYHFKDCTIVSFKGSNTTFDSCRFGGTYKDALVPYCNVTVKNSLFCDMASSDTAGNGVHTDATQIYGEKGVDVTNVHYENCRFEVPAMQEGLNSATVNACIMLQLEYSNGNDITFTDCTLNGGGYSMYASAKNGCTYQNVKFNNINIGCTRVYGLIYPNVSEGITLKNIRNTNSLYIGSVWKKNGKTYVSVTNDTNTDRVLKIYADGKVYEYEIEASPNGNALYSDYEQYPFDIPVCIDKDVKYVVCYDATYTGDVKQIRFVNWGEKKVMLSEADKTLISGSDNTGKSEVVLQGECGKEASYVLTQNGVLTISGKGPTDNYHSQKRAPWFEKYRYDIREVIVEEGITLIGNQMFTDCSYIEKVVLPNTLEIIGARAFAKCTSLLEIEIPASVKAIYENAFVNVLLQDVIYEGSDSEWESVKVDEKNTNVIDKVQFGTTQKEDSQDISTYLLRGNCGLKGNNITFTIDKNGVLTLTGTGEMDNYHSRKNAPWWEYREFISTVVINEGITNVGSQAFISCINLEKVDLPDSLRVIRNNAFQRCRKLKTISIPKDVKSIWAYAFHNTSLVNSFYEGARSAWSQVTVHQKNDELKFSMR